MRAPLASVVAVLAAGCLSSPPDAVGGPLDAAPPAAPDASSLDLVERVMVPSDCTVVTSQKLLAAGVGHQLVISGLVQVGAEVLADADYFWNRATPADIRDLSADIDLGVAIDDPDVDAERLPDWGAYRDDHRYQVEIIGQGAAIQAQFHDTQCGNNSGFLTLDILGPPG
ncbi:MAG TPA: hypothetical protein VFU21_30375 [Kofleriaceae bacterium]|nr:hypothetical protein [Kofleriaceae bacterium]